MNNDRTAAIEKIRRFSEKYLGGDLDNLLTFSMSKTFLDNEFGSPGRRFDCDDTEIMRSIYIVLFADVWPGLTAQSLADYTFRGETINTYNTLFGRPNKETMHPGLDKFSPSTELCEKVAQFRTTYHYIGNFVVLPNLEFGCDTINRYRGCHADWRDFFDRFFVALEAVLTEQADVDDKLKDLVETNNSALQPYFGTVGFKKLATTLLLEDYLNDDGSPFANSKGFYWWQQGVDRDEYFAEAERFIDFSTQVIKNRGQRMIAALKEALQQYERTT